MTFQLFGFDVYFEASCIPLFGFWIGSIKIETLNNTWHRSLLGFYCNDGMLTVDLLYFKIGRDY
jgi:hypothetical protein